MTFLSSLAMGWRSVGLMRPMRLRTWRTRIAGRLHRRAPRASRRGPFAEVEAAWDGRRQRRPELSLESTPRCEAMALLVERSGSLRLRHVRDAAYFHWRFQHPLSRYRFLYWTDQQLQGYLVLQEYVSAYAVKRVTNIVDWEADNDAIRADLLVAALSLVRGRDLVIWSSCLSESVRALLGRSGFQPDPEPDSAARQRDVLLVRPSGDPQPAETWQFAGQRLLELENWDLCMLYSMHG
jgi:hypothetical protein